MTDRDISKLGFFIAFKLTLLAYLNVTLVVNRDVIGLNQTDVMDECRRLDNGITKQ